MKNLQEYFSSFKLNLSGSFKPVKRILLIKSPIDSKDTFIDQWNMPLDLMAVASAAIKEGCFVEILDGAITDLPSILSQISKRFDIVGVNYNVYSVRSARKILQTAREAGCFVIVGGQAATGNCDLLIQQTFVDAVIVGDGEPAMKAFAKIPDFKHKYLQHIPNLLYKYNGMVKRTHAEEFDLYHSGLVDRTIGGLNPFDYFAEYPRSCTIQNIKCTRPSNIYAKRGCPRNCSFCARIDRSVPRVRQVELVGEEIKYLIEKYQVDYIIDHSETWFEKNWIFQYEKYYARHLSHYDFRMFVFADIRDINSETASLMAKVNIDQTLIGIESGSPRILKRNGKYYSRDKIINAVDLLVKNNIGVYASFVIGQLDEDEESLEETYSLIKILSAYANVKCNCNIIVPLPHSNLWKPFVDSLDTIPLSISDPFEYDYTEITKLFLKSQTKVSLPMLEKFASEVNSLK